MRKQKQEIKMKKIMAVLSAMFVLACGMMMTGCELKEALEKVTKRVEFVTFDANKLSGTYARYPERNELNADINEALIVEFYNK